MWNFIAGLVIGAVLGLLVASLCRVASEEPPLPPQVPKREPATEFYRGGKSA
jgi:hypothetical protein